MQYKGLIIEEDKELRGDFLGMGISWICLNIHVKEKVKTKKLEIQKRKKKSNDEVSQEVGVDGRKYRW